MMEDNRECKSCKTWEEEFYWKHFSFMHFCVTLPPDFHDHLLLPQKFAAHMKTQLPDKVSLKSPSGALWDVELLNTSDLLFVGNGWKSFVKANELKENCILVFKYKRNSNFEVLIFDQESSCERESSYFVKKCMHAEPGQGDKKRTVREEASGNEVVEEGDVVEDDAVVVSKRSRKDDGAVNVNDSGEKIIAQTPKKQVCGAAKRVGGSRIVVPTHKSPEMSKVQSREKSVSTEIAIAREASPNSQRDAVTPETDNDHSQELQSQSKKRLNGNATSKELNQTDHRTVSPSENHCPKSKGQSDVPGKQPSVHGKESRQNSKRDFINTKNGESVRVNDLSNKSKAQSEKRPMKVDTSKEPLLITPDKGEHVPFTNGSQAEMVQKERTGTGRGPAKMIIPNYREITSEEDCDSSKSHGRGRGRGRGKGRGRAKLSVSTKKLVFNSEETSGRKSTIEYRSNRRPVTDVEKDETLQRAIQRQTEKCFITVMRPTSVYKRFFMTVPIEWVYKHLSTSRSQKFVLRVGDKTWDTTLFYYGSKGAGLSTGWKKFAVDNFLEEFDVLLFKLASRNDNEAVVMDVDIFRVVDNSVPPPLVVS